MSTTAPLPRLRTIEVIHLPGEDGRPVALLRDRLDPQAKSVIVSREGLLLASLLDGEKGAESVRRAFHAYTGASLGAADIRRFVEQLDQAYLLDTPRAQGRIEDLYAEFRALALRPAAHAGGSYPAEARELRRFLDDLYHHADGPGGSPRASGSAGRLVGLIAPHIDLHRGGPTYAWAYRALAEAEPADTYVLLGTCHAGMRSPVAATRKPYDTPFGAVPTDTEFLDALQARYGADLYADEYRHRAEHALEFQALYLGYLGLAHGRGGARSVPILCNALQSHVAADASPADTPAIARFVTALRETIAASGKRVCLVAGADLAHVGPQFGDAEPLVAADLERVAAGDREMLELACAADAEGFYRQVLRDGDARRICGFAPIYLMLATLDAARGDLLRYAQWVDSTGNGSVTYAAVAFRPAGL